MNLLEIFKDSDDLVEFSAGDVIMTEGLEGNHMYVVMKGAVYVSIKSRVIATALPGDIVGEMADQFRDSQRDRNGTERLRAGAH